MAPQGWPEKREIGAQNLTFFVKRPQKIHIVYHDRNNIP